MSEWFGWRWSWFGFHSGFHQFDMSKQSQTKLSFWTRTHRAERVSCTAQRSSSIGRTWTCLDRWVWTGLPAPRDAPIWVESSCSPGAVRRPASLLGSHAGPPNDAVRRQFFSAQVNNSESGTWSLLCILLRLPGCLLQTAFLCKRLYPAHWFCHFCWWLSVDIEQKATHVACFPLIVTHSSGYVVQTCAVGKKCDRTRGSAMSERKQMMWRVVRTTYLSL